MNVEASSFGPALKSLRQQLGLSQMQLAGDLGTTQRHISFLETGRARPSRTMVLRLATGLDLNGTQRNALLAASGLREVTRSLRLSDPEVSGMLDMLDKQVLQAWPYPAFILNENWDVLRRNKGGAIMLEMLGAKEPENLLVGFLSDRFTELVDNWMDVSASLFFRLQAAARRSDRVRQALELATTSGKFDGLGDRLTGGHDAAPFEPITLTLPNGAKINLSSLLSRVGTVHETLIEDMEIELVFPSDDTSAEILRAMMAK